MKDKIIALLKSPLTWLVIGLVVMFFALVNGKTNQAAAAVYAEARQGEDYVQLMDEKCTSAKILEHASDLGELIPQLRKAVVSIGGQTHAACWVQIADGEGIGLVYEDGDRGAMPARIFEK